MCVFEFDRIHKQANVESVPLRLYNSHGNRGVSCCGCGWIARRIIESHKVIRNVDDVVAELNEHRAHNSHSWDSQIVYKSIRCPFAFRIQTNIRIVHEAIVWDWEFRSSSFALRLANERPIPADNKTELFIIL